MKLEISLFRFDYKSDYLPYYTKHIVKIKDEKNLLDIFKTINEDQAFGFKDCEYYTVAINGVFAHLNITIEELKNSFGKEITIEPMSIRRAHTDLLVNEDDFNERLNILASYKDEELTNTYNSYKIYYYASNTLNYEKNYIGDAILLLAYDLIQKFPKEEKNILKTIQDNEVGIEFHTSLTNRVYKLDEKIENNIQTIKNALNISKDEQNFRVNNTYIMDFGEFETLNNIKHDFKDFNIAYYEGINGCDATKELLDTLNAKQLNLESLKVDLALDTFHINPDLTYKLASNMMLDAFDQNADLLIVDSVDLFYLCDYNRKELSRVAGRDVSIPVIHKNELSKLAMGSHHSVRQTLEKHIINPELI